MTATQALHPEKPQPIIFYNREQDRRVRSQIKTFADKAGNLANQIIAKEYRKEYTGPEVIRHHHYHYGYSYWSPFYYNPTPIVVVPSGGNSRRRDKDDNSFAIGVIGTILSLAAIYFVGAGIAKYQDASEELEEVDNFKDELARGISLSNGDLVDEATHAAALTGRICKRIKNSALQDLTLRIGMLSGAVMLGAGGFASTPALITAGAVTGVAALGGMLFKWGLDSSNRANLRDAEALLNSVKNLNKF